MAIYRTISMSFWTDSKVVDDFTPEDRYFYLYLFTNPHTNLCGCYEVSIKQIAYEIGYSVDSINMLLKRFEEVHKVISYCEDTKELLLINWHKYNWTTSDKFRKPLLREISEVKSKAFKDYLQALADGEDARYGIDTNCMDTSVIITDTVSNNKPVSNNSKRKPDLPDWATEVVDYLNEKTGKHFKVTSSANTKFISARAKEGYTADDFKKVIDTKTAEWKDTDMEQYLRPETLFSASKFEGYLNQRTIKKTSRNDFNNFDQHDYDMDELTKRAKRRG